MRGNENKRLIAIDGNSLMHRAFYALPAMTSREGVPTGAVFGFLSMLLKLIERAPDYLVVAFDMHGPTFRHEQYADYKAGRRETPDDLRTQFPILRELLDAMGVPVCTCERYEADDILGTFSRMAEQEGVDALLVTGDRDALQLISAHTHVLLTKKGISETDEMDEAALEAAYGLTPERMKDLKGLMGDNSDNIPGIPGVGEKTALKLLHEYGDMEAVLDNGGRISGKLGEKVRAFADQARMSYALGVIHTDAPIEKALADAAFDPSRMAEGRARLYAYQLNAIVQRLPKADEKTEPAAGAKMADIVWLEDIAALQAAVAAVKDAALLGVHAEGDMLTFAVDEAKEYRLRLMGTLLEPGLVQEDVLRAMKPLFEAERPQKALFDAKRWMHSLAAEGIALGGLAFDAMIADYLINAIRPTGSLAALASAWLPGGEASARALLALSRIMGEALRNQGLSGLYEDVERPLIRVLYEMERTGFLLDMDVLDALEKQFAQRAEELQKEIYACAGESFNILSPKQLGTVLFDKLQLPVQRKTKTGFSTDADVLEKLMDMHPIVPLVQEYRFLTKLKSTFVDGLMGMVSEKDKRVHTSFNQNVTATGRISSAEPNLQNIPVRTALGREIRKAFIASEGNVLVGADYSQIELRILAHISGDEGMRASFLEGGDIHTRTAGEVFGVNASAVTPEMRSAAKAVNFGIVYGISDFGLARNLNISKKQAGEYIERYLDRYPGVRAYMRESVERGGRDGFVRTLLGRRRELPELKDRQYTTRSFGERVAMNMPIQGSAADIIKLAMVRVFNELKRLGLKTRLILQVHDELILDAPMEEASRVSELLRDCMQNAMSLSVPLSVDVKCGHSWFDTK